MPRAVLRAIVLSATLAGGAAHAAEPAANIEPGPGIMQRIDYHLNQAPNLARHMANECVLASVAAMVVAAATTGPIAPAVSAALGVAPGYTIFTIGGLACGAGALAGGVAAGAWAAWSERATIGEAAQTQIATLFYGPATSAAEGGGGLVGQASRLTAAASSFLAFAMPTGWYIQETQVADASRPSEMEVAIMIRPRQDAQP